MHQCVHRQLQRGSDGAAPRRGRIGPVIGRRRCFQRQDAEGQRRGRRRAGRRCERGLFRELFLTPLCLAPPSPPALATSPQSAASRIAHHDGSGGCRASRHRARAAKDPRESPISLPPLLTIRAPCCSSLIVIRVSGFRASFV